MLAKSSKFLALIALFAISFGCTKKQSLEYGLKLEETFRVNILTEPPSLDWSISTDTTSSLIETQIMEGLSDFDFSGEEIKVKPMLATEWTASDKAKKWTIKLRPDVKWTDGQPLVAQHFIDGWERLLNPMTASEYAYFIYGVKNAKAYNQGKIKDFSQVGIKAINEHTLEVQLEQSMSFFPFLWTHHSTFPIRKDVVEKHGNRWTRPENIVTLGPYKLKLWENDKAMVLETNELYYGEKPKTKNILAYMIKEQSTAVNLFDSGKIDLLYELPSTDLPKLKTRPEFQQMTDMTIYYYGFNIKKPPFNNVDFRRAISHAIDRKEIITLIAGGQTPIKGWLPAGMMAYTDEVGLDFDVAKAKEYFAKAGFNEKNPAPKIEVSFNTNENHQKIAENVQAQLKRNLGLTVELKNEEWKVYLKSLQTDASQIYRMGWQADYPDPDNFLNLMTSFSENNHTNWGNPEFDKLIEQGAAELDAAKRVEIYKRAQKILVETDIPVFPVFSRVTHVLLNPRVKDLKQNRMAQWRFKELTLAAE